MIQVSIIIVNYNAGYFLLNCLESVTEACRGLEAEVIVVDNGSTDASRSLVKTHFSELMLIENPRNLGFSKACNLGASKARGQYLLLLNPDTVLAEGTLHRVIALAEKDSSIGAIGISFVDGKGRFLPECKRNLPTAKIALLKLLGIGSGYYAASIEKDGQGTVDVLTGAFMFMRISVFTQLKGFDEDFFMYGEDIDLSFRILDAGYQNYYLGSCTMIHFKGESTIKDKAYLRNFYGALRIFYKKHVSRNRLPGFLLNALVAGLIFIRSFRRSSGRRDGRSVKGFIYVGSDERMFKKLLGSLPGASGKQTAEIPENPGSADTLFLDSSSLSYREIIRITTDGRYASLAKRIISKQGTFYLGSDSSEQRGEAVLI